MFAHLGIVFYGLNSVWPASSEGLPGRSVDEFVVGRVGETLDQIRRQCEANGVPKPFVVGVVHHSPFGDVADRAIVNTDFFAKFLMGAGSTNLLCFGHIHKSGVKAEELEDQKKVICSRASTVTKLSRARDEDTNRGFNLCVLNRKGGSVKDCQVTVFEWMGQRLLSRALSKYEVG